MKLGSSILLTAASVAWLSCNTVDPPPPPPPPPPEIRISLSPDEIGIDDVVFSLSFQDSVPVHLTSLIRDGEVIWQGIVYARDTSIVDSMLNLRTTYVYVALAIRDSIDSVATDPVTLTTLDTTSHQFDYDIQTFGDFSPSAIYDVAILNDHSAIAVGEIYLRDSLGQYDPRPFNLLRWDGTSWHLSREQVIVHGVPITIPFFGVSALSEDNFWVANNQVWEWTNPTWSTHSLEPNLWVSILAVSPTEIYSGSNRGGVAYFDGSSWNYASSGTSMVISDFCRMTDGNVVAGGSSGQYVTGVVVKGRGSQWQRIVEGVNSVSIDPSELWRTKVYGETGSVWCDERNVIYTAGSFLYRCKNGRWGFMGSLPGNFLFGNPGNQFWGFLRCVRGNRSNDLVVSGLNGTLLHFNGRNWAYLGPPYSPTSSDELTCAAMNGNLLIVGGQREGRAMIIVLRRG